MTWLILTFVTVVVAFLLTAWTIFQIQAVSTGPAIPPGRQRKALIVVDLQRTFLHGDAFPNQDVTDLIEGVTERMEQARRTGEVTIALQHIWQGTRAKALARLTMGGHALPDDPHLALDPRVQALADHHVAKHVQDGFDGTTLGELLKKLDVGTLEFVGLDGVYCVRATALAAKNRGFNVTLNPKLTLTVAQKNWEKLLQNAPKQAIGVLTP